MILLHGVFFQENFGHIPIPVINQKLFQGFYSGVIIKREILSGHEGSMCDQFGYSELSEIEIGESQVKFTKAYVHRKDLIYYSFRLKEGNIWIGEYTGKATGTGISCCTLMEVPDIFLDPHSITKMLGRISAYDRPGEKGIVE